MSDCILTYDPSSVTSNIFDNVLNVHINDYEIYIRHNNNTNTIINKNNVTTKTLVNDNYELYLINPFYRIYYKNNTIILRNSVNSLNIATLELPSPITNINHVYISNKGKIYDITTGYILWENIYENCYIHKINDFTYVLVTKNNITTKIYDQYKNIYIKDCYMINNTKLFNIWNRKLYKILDKIKKKTIHNIIICNRYGIKMNKYIIDMIIQYVIR